MAVNLSARQLRSPELVGQVETLLQQYQLSPSKLELELTERVILDASHAQTQLSLQSLQDMGLRLALDDFGTGYSSLRYLTEHRFNVLKIDKSFVQALADKGKEYTLVAALIAIARELEMSVVAEGVETAEQLLLLNELNCPSVQGFYFSKPQLPDVLDAQLVKEDGCWYLRP